MRKAQLEGTINDAPLPPPRMQPVAQTRKKDTGETNVDLFPNEEITNPKVMSAPLLARRRAVLTFSLTVAPKP